MKERFAQFADKNIWLRKSNISMLILSAYYIGLTLYSMYYGLQGYVFYPNNRERLLNLFMFVILVLAFMIASPDKETHKITPFTIICSSVLAVCTGIFAMRIIYVHINYEAVFTLLLVVLAFTVSIASTFGMFKSYDATEYFDTAKGKIVAYIPKFINVAAIIVAVIFMIGTPFWTEGKYIEPQSFSTSFSPKRTHVAKTEEEKQEDGSVKYYIRIYENQKDKEIFFGKFDYIGSFIAEFPIENREQMDYVWLSEKSFIAQGKEYNFK